MKRLLIALVLFIAANAQAQTAACTQTSALSCGTSTATLNASDCASFDASYYHLWTFSGSAGDVVTIDMTSSSFDAFLAVLDPNGTPIADNDDVSSTNTNARISFTLTATGTWTIVANSLKATQTGAYTLTLTSSACPAVPSTPRRRAVGRG